jgi:hypothetical protein
VVSARIDGAAVWLREDPAAFLPELAGPLTLLTLCLFVLAECLDERSWDADRAAAGPGLHVDLLEAAAMALRTLARVPLAV